MSPGRMHPTSRFALAALLIFSCIRTLGTSGATDTHEVVLGNSPSTISGPVVNHGNPITLTPGATTSVDINFVVSDNNGCGDVFFRGSLVAGIQRTSAGCSTFLSATNLLYCYFTENYVHDCPSATTTQVSANVTATVDMYYFAQATDASSSFPSEVWQASIGVSDPSGGYGFGGGANAEVNSLLALDTATGTLAYGTVSPGASTTGNFPVTVVNRGNSSATLQLSGNALANGGNSFPTSSQHYATSTFTYGGLEQALSSAATAVSGFLLSRPPLTSWSQGTLLPATNYNQHAVAHNGYLYSIGGNAGPGTSTVLFAPINATGSIGAWATTTPLPGSVSDHASAVNNGFVYVVGGYDTAATSTVLFAPINATGSIGTWTQTTVLPAATRLHGVLTENSYLYSIGGAGTSTVLFAPINATGSIGAWATTTPLKTNNYRIKPVLDNAIVYIPGGGMISGVASSTVTFARLNSNGTLGTWSETAPLPGPVAQQGTASYNGHLYSVGGCSDAICGLTSVYYAPIASRNTYWGLQVPSGVATGTFSGTNTFTAVFSP
jgi:hypothetical protein